MYLTISDYTWSETGTEVLISVPLRGLAFHKSDVMVTSRYIKLVYKPYMFECLLFKPVEPDATHVELVDNMVHFRLQKLVPENWSQLQSEEMKDKQLLLQHRQQAIVEFQEREKTKENARRESVRKGEKISLSQLMKMEDLERQRISRVKEEETKSALEEFTAKQQEAKQFEQNIKQQIFDAKCFAKKLSCEKQLQLTDVDQSATKPLRTSIHKEALLGRELLEKPMPLPVRVSSTIKVSFTPRVFPTPERESKKQEEEEWLAKQAEHRRAAERRVLAGDELTEKECDHTWLKKKGDSLFRAGDLDGAVAAYTKAIDINPNMHSAYSNRAACHLQLRNYFKALDDSSKVLSICTPPVELNLSSRLKAHVRRGAALCHLQMYKEALVEYEAAKKLKPEDISIGEDIGKLEAIINSDSIN